MPHPHGHLNPAAQPLTLRLTLPTESATAEDAGRLQDGKPVETVTWRPGWPGPLDPGIVCGRRVSTVQLRVLHLFWGGGGTGL